MVFTGQEDLLGMENFIHQVKQIRDEKKAFTSLGDEKNKLNIYIVVNKTQHNSIADEAHKNTFIHQIKILLSQKFSMAAEAIYLHESTDNNAEQLFNQIHQDAITPYNKLIAFNKIYIALRRIKFGIGKSKFTDELEKVDMFDQLRMTEQHAHKKDSRTEISWGLANEHLDECHDENVVLINAMLKWNAKHNMLLKRMFTYFKPSHDLTLDEVKQKKATDASVAEICRVLGPRPPDRPAQSPAVLYNGRSACHNVRRQCAIRLSIVF